MSHAEYELDREEHWKKARGEESQDSDYHHYTYSIHTYGATGRTPGLAGLFQEGPTTLVEEVVKKPKKNKKKKASELTD